MLWKHRTLVEQSWDAVIVGAGHNGLVCACYLAKAGLKVLVLERRPIVGGAVCTQTDLLLGYRVDVGSAVHIMIHRTPILQELELERFGLQYIEMDPWAYYPIVGTGSGISFHRDVNQTCQSIAAVSPRDAEAYAAFVRDWSKLNEIVFDAFLEPPTMGRLLGKFLRLGIAGTFSRGNGTEKRMPPAKLMRQLMLPYGRVVNETFEHPAVRAAMLWLSAQSGPPPTEPASGDLLGWNAMIHSTGAWRARGGSGMLTQALARRLQSDGWKIVTGAVVERVSREGKLWRVEYADQVATATSVVSACHVQTFFEKILNHEDCPQSLRHRVSQARTGNGFGMMARFAVDALPQYDGSADGSRIQPWHSAMQLLCPSAQHLDQAHRDYLHKRPPQEPAAIAMTFSALDDTLAPPGKHLLYLWGQYHPYELAGGEHWDAIGDREAEKLYELLCRYAPNMKTAKREGRVVQTPLDLERTLGLVRGNVMHLEMSLNQMFAFRPVWAMSAYRTPIRGLYLTGAGTHPGGGVFGASGYNAARVILKDFR